MSTAATATQDNHFRYRRGTGDQRLNDAGRGPAGDDVVLYSPISSSDQLHQPVLSNTLGDDGGPRGCHGASPPRRRCKLKPALPPVYPNMAEDDEMADVAGSALQSMSVGTPSRRPRAPWAVSETHGAEEDALPYDTSTTPRVKQVARATHKSNIVFSPQTDFAAVGMELGDDLSWSAADMQFFSLSKDSKEQLGLQAHVQLPAADTGVTEEGTDAGADDSGDDSDAAAKPPTPPPPVSRDMATFRIS